jgi:peptidyl-prolyl cis-trans isomerase D
MKNKLITLSKNLLVKALIVLIIAVFALWGAGDMFSAGKTNVVAEVSGENIYAEDYVSVLRIQLPQKYSSTSAAIKNNFHLEILNQLVAEKILEIYAKDKKIIISDQTLSNFIKKIPEFLNDNKFSRTRYEKYLLQNQINSYDFEQNYKKNLLKKMIIESQSLSFATSNYHKKKIKDYFKKQVLINYINLKNVYKKNIVTEKEILDFHKKNPSYSDEFRSINYSIIEPKKNQKNYDLFFKNISEIENEVLSNKMFEEISKKFSLDIKKSNLFNIDGYTKDAIKLINFEKKIIEKSFYLNEQAQSELIEIQGKFYLIGINKILKKKLLVLNNTLKEKITEEIQKIYLNKKINSLNTKIKDKNIFKNLTLKNINDIKELMLRNRFEKNDVFSSKQMQKIFSLEKDNLIIVNDSQPYLVKVIKITTNNERSSKEMEELYKRQVIANFERLILQSFDKFLNNKYEIKINQKVLNRITNSF